MSKQIGNEQGVEQLIDFVEKAARLGKYPANTAGGIVSPLKIVSRGLTPEEPTDLDYISEHIDEIFHRQARILNLTSASLQVYIRRVRRVIRDFKQYGTDPKKFNAWRPAITRRVEKKAATMSNQADERSNASMPRSQPTDGQTDMWLRTLTWALRKDLLIQIQLPSDLNANDAARLKKLLDLEVEMTSGVEEVAP